MTANFCKLTLTFALRLLSLQIIALFADIANTWKYCKYCKLLQMIAILCKLLQFFLQIIVSYCKLLQIDPHLCTQTSEFAHSQPGLLSNSTLCPAPDVESYNDEYYILICNTYIKYISKWIKGILLKQHQFKPALLYFFRSESCGRLSHPNAYKDHTSLPGEPGPTKNEDFDVENDNRHPSHFFKSTSTKNGVFFYRKLNESWLLRKWWRWWGERGGPFIFKDWLVWSLLF